MEYDPYTILNQETHKQIVWCTSCQIVYTSLTQGHLLNGEEAQNASVHRNKGTISKGTFLYLTAH